MDDAINIDGVKLMGYTMWGCIDLVCANRSVSSVFLRSWHHFLSECHQYRRIVEPLGIVGTLLFNEECAKESC